MFAQYQAWQISRFTNPDLKARRQSDCMSFASSKWTVTPRLWITSLCAAGQSVTQSSLDYALRAGVVGRRHTFPPSVFPYAGSQKRGSKKP
jgi:hypothetical protein